MPRRSPQPASALLYALALLCLAACAPMPSASVSPISTATSTLAPTATASPTPTTVPDWQRFTDPRFGFTLDVPGVLWADPNMQPQLSATDSMTVFVYHGRTGVRPSQFASLFNPGGILQVFASTAPAPVQCSLQGLLVTVGSGISGYRDDTFIHPPTGAAYAAGGSVSFVTGGLYVSLWLSANDAATQDQYWTTFGPAWHHILASFVPGPPPSNGHPCG